MLLKYLRTCIVPASALRDPRALFALAREAGLAGLVGRLFVNEPAQAALKRGGERTVSMHP